MNRLAAETYVLDAPHVLVSIGSPRRAPATLPESTHRVAVVRLEFDDVDLVDPLPPLEEWWSPDEPPPVLFDASLAATLRDGVARHLDRSTWVACHCEAGLSRSPAVAIALSRWINGDDLVATAISTWVTCDRLGLDAGVIPWNRRVYSVLASVLGLAALPGGSESA